MFLKRVAPLCAVLALLVAPFLNHGIAQASQDEGDGSFSVLMATDLVVPNAGYFFVVDFDTQNATTVARTGGAAVPPNVPRNGFFIHLNGSNDDWVVEARSYVRGVETLRPLSEFSIWNYEGAVAHNGSFLGFADRASDAVLIWSANDLETTDRPVDATVTFTGIDFTDGAVGDVQVGSASAQVSPGVRITQGEKPYSALLATDLVVPNAGTFFVVDFDRQTTSVTPRSGSAPVPDVIPQNGFVIHLNGNNDDWLVEARSYADSVETIRPTDEFSIWNYDGSVAPNGSFLGFADRATDAVLIWAGNGLATAQRPVNATATFAGIDFTDGAVGDIQVGSVSTTLLKVGSRFP